jgi:type IV pilus assembly protein PilE
MRPNKRIWHQRFFTDRQDKKQTASIRGFTLLELMIVLLLVTVLVAMAVPSYQQYLARTHRAAAIEILLSTASCQQNIYAAEFRYDTRRCLANDPGGNYEFRIEPKNTASTTVFTVIARPVGAQQQDPCQELSLNQSGWRDTSGPAEQSRKCWEGR